MISDLIVAEKNPLKLKKKLKIVSFQFLGEIIKALKTYFLNTVIL